MYYLTSKQIDLVVSEVRHAEITFSHLKDDLIDHLCCEIEAEINRGANFDEAFQKIKQNVGIKNLKRVQENTLLLIDKKYKAMKTTMKISGLASITLLAFGALFKIMHWPGASVMLLVGFLFLTSLFFPIALWVLRKESKLKHPVFLYISGFISGAIVMVGFLFKIMHWPGANVMLILGYLSLCFIFMPTLLHSMIKNTENKSLKFSYFIGVISFSICLLGDLFKIIHWPGAAVMLLFGSIVLVSIFLPFYAFIKYKDSAYIQESFIFLSMGILIFTFFNNLLAMNLSKDLLSQFVTPINKLENTSLFIEKGNNINYQNLLTDTLNNNNAVRTQILKVKNETNELSNYIHDLQILIITSVDKANKEQANMILKNPTNLKGKDNFDIPTHIMIGSDQIHGSKGKAHELKKNIERYKSTLFDILKNNKSTINIIEDLFNLKDKLSKDNGEKITWEMSYFYHNIAISTLNVLANLNLNLRIVESEAIKQIALKHEKKLNQIKSNH